MSGGREGHFIEKPDIIDKFCRRKITEWNPELGAMSVIHFGKMFEPIRSKNKDEEEEEESDNDDNDRDVKSVGTLWTDDDDRIANFYITTNPEYNEKRLPKTIKIMNCQPGEISIWRKRSFPKAARIHKKKEDLEPYRYFLSELILYHGFTDEKDLGSEDEQKCKALYFKYKDAIQFVKSHMMPFSQGIEEARYNVEQAMHNDNQEQEDGKIGDILDAEQEQEIEECQDGEEEILPEFAHLNPNDAEFENENVTEKAKRTLRNIEIKSPDERLEDARRLDKYQKRALHIAINFAIDVIISRKGKIPYPKAPTLMVVQAVVNPPL